MNIKSNKENKSMWNMDVGKWIGSLITDKKYWLTLIVWGIFATFVLALEGTWGIQAAVSIIAISVHLVVVGIAENNRVDSERWNDRKADISIFSLFGIPLIIVALSYWNVTAPMYQDYKTADRIDRVLPMNEVNLFYNDENSIFVLFVEGQKQPLIIDKGGHSDTYNRLKADFLDKKIQVIKKETKGWTDTNSSIQYHLDDSIFD
ncbi:MAG: hypothetical protein DRH57_03745 [Candidatus Cloacimonadota bacterium]|nr:MAG: hypothetical protein DRH57_03745 [Candidatus Cloacimonadota bacterium]